MSLTPTQLEIHVFTPGPVAAWREFCVRLGLLDGSTKETVFAKSFIILKNARSRWDGVFGKVHTVGPRRKKQGLALHWHFEWRTALEAPPANVLESSKRLGGLEGFFSRFDAEWPQQAPRECEGDFTCHFSSPAEEVACLPWPKRHHCGKGRERLSLDADFVGWEFTPPVGTLASLGISKEGANTVLIASGSWAGQIDPTMLRDVRTSARRSVQRVIELCRS
jgi:hypothetical protein